MKALKPVLKVWYNFICATVKPSLHPSPVTRDKTILFYAIAQGIKLDVRHVIVRGIIESTYGQCIGDLIRLSLITQMCRLSEVPMHELEEKSTHRLPVLFLKTKHGDTDDMEDKDKVEEELGDKIEVDEAPRGYQ